MTSQTQLIHPGRNLSKADVFRVDSGDTCLAVKTYRERPWWLRQTLGRMMIRHEAAIYERIRDVPGTVEYVGRPDPISLKMRYVQGVPLGSLRGVTLADALFVQLTDTVRAIHRRGVVLMDLHDWDILVDLEAEQVWVLDFGAAIRHSGPLTQLDEILLGKFCQRYWGGEPAKPSGLVGTLWRGHHALSGGWRRFRRRVRSTLHGESRR